MSFRIRKGILFLFLSLFTFTSYSDNLLQQNENFNLDYLYILGETASLKGQKQTAAALFRKINENKTGFHIQLRLAQEYWDQGLIKSAKIVCRQIINQFSEKTSAPARLLLAEIYRAARLFDQAMEQYERVLSVFPNHYQALFNQTLLLIALRHPLPSNRLSLFKDSSTFYKSMGDIYLEQNQTDLAVQAFQNAFQLDPSSRYAAWRLFQLCGQKNQLRLFIDFMEKTKHSDSYMISLLARAYLRQGKRQKVQTYLADLLWDDPIVLDLRAEWTMGPFSRKL